MIELIEYDDGAITMENLCRLSLSTPHALQDNGMNYCPNCGAKMFAKDTNVPNKKGADNETD